MKTKGLFTSATRLAVGFALAILFQPSNAEAGKPQPVTKGVEFKITSPIDFHSVPDYTAGPDSDQCRSTKINSDMLVQRMTTLNIRALGNPCFQVESYRGGFHLDFGAMSAGFKAPVTFNFWVTKNCLLTAVGTIVSGEWPLTDGLQLVVEVPAGAEWTFMRYGGPMCSGTSVLTEPVKIVATRNDARDFIVCDCPFDYNDADGNMIAAECE